MMRSALNAIDAHSETTAMIGDRMDTDIVAGHRGRPRDDPRAHRRHHARPTTERFPFRPSRIVESVADLADELQ